MKKTMVSMFAALLLCGCGAGVDENKTPEQAKSEAASMEASALQKRVDACKKFIEQKQAQVDSLAKEIANIPLQEKLGEKAKSLKAEADKIGVSIKNVGAQLDAYVKELQAKGANK